MSNILSKTAIGFAAMTMNFSSQAAGETKEKGVDLGLSVIWSAQVVKTDASNDYSSQFVWASPFSRESYTELNAYVPSDVYVGNNIASSIYDAATVNWGNGWRLPTKAEAEELLDHVVGYRNIDDQKGYLVEGNGNSVFYTDLESDFGMRFWTADMFVDEANETDFSKAWICELYFSKKQMTQALRDKPCVILPVRDKNIEVSGISLPYEQLTLNVGEKSLLYPIVMPENAANKWVNFTSSNSEVVSVDKFGRIEALKDGEATITASAADGSGVECSCAVTVPLSGGPSFVDLGLSVFWCDHNVGAQTMQDPGYYFMFATPQIVEKWSANASPYVDTREVPVKNVQGTQYDPATVFMGAGWMTPTKEQMQELFDNCDCVDVENGFNMISKINGESIFIPFSGYKYVTALNSKSSAYLQTAETNDVALSGQYPVAKFPEGMNPFFENRSNTQGVPVRAIKVKNPESVSAFKTSATTVDVYNLQGVKVADGITPSSVNKLSQGIYIVKDGFGHSEKIKL